MKIITNIAGSTLGPKIVIRFSQVAFKALKKRFLKDRHNEQFAFALFSQAKTAEGTVLIVRDIFFPDEEDMLTRSRFGVCPTKKFQALVYLAARQKGLGIMDVHTHPFQQVPSFSPIDEAESAKNAASICKNLPYPITMAMMVFDKDMETFDSCVYDRSLNGFRKLDSMEILGRGIEVKYPGEPHVCADENDPTYSRQISILGWDQTTLARLKIVVAGAGGNGAQMFQTLVSLGVGTEGWMAVIDPDTVEQSNLPRIPYANPDDIGQPKVTLATRYAHMKNPRAKVYPDACSVNERPVKNRIKGANIIIGAGDGDGLRQVCNELAVQYMIPYIDLGCEILVNNNKVEAGGQVRIILPGTNACLICCGGLDTAAAAIELMDDAQAAVHAARGYLRGSNQQATPSVANLNATIAQLGVAALLALIHGEKFGAWDYIHYDQLTAQTITAESARNEKCPLCGPYGILARGDAPEAAPTEPAWQSFGPPELSKKS